MLLVGETVFEVGHGLYLTYSYLESMILYKIFQQIRIFHALFELLRTRQ